MPAMGKWQGHKKIIVLIYYIQQDVGICVKGEAG
jgi:hypothetical protein